MADKTAEIEGFIRDAAAKRGIDPDIAIRAFKTEGGTDEYARLGDFSGPPWYSGKSWWPPQLHYGGAGYESFGKTAGMGGGFTALTGWAPGDPRAWRDSVRYALNRVKAGGWGPWYGPATVGITGFTGVDRNHPWDANSEVWDFETGITPMPKPTYNLDYPIRTQDHDWDCFQESANWALHAAGRSPDNGWLEQQMLADAIESTANGLEDGSGAQAAAWLTRQYAEPGANGAPAITAHNVANVGFDDVRSIAGTAPVLIGGHHWGSAGHWTGVRGYDAANDRLVLANPGGTGPVYGQQTLDRQQFNDRGPWSMVVLQAAGAEAPTPTPPAPVPAPPADDRDAVIAQLRAELAEKDRRLQEAVSKLGFARGDIAAAVEKEATSIRASLGAMDAAISTLKGLVPS